MICAQVVQLLCAAALTHEFVHSAQHKKVATHATIAAKASARMIDFIFVEW